MNYIIKINFSYFFLFLMLLLENFKWILLHISFLLNSTATETVDSLIPTHIVKFLYHYGTWDNIL